MKIIVPLSIQSIASEFGGANHPSVIKSAFRDHVDAPIQKRTSTVYGLAEFFKEVQR